MTSRERAAYDALPETVMIYRGQEARWEPGICWSLDREVANRFAVRFRGRNPVVLTAKVSKCDILAVKLNRGEQEVITFAAAIAAVKVHRNPAAPALAKEYLRLRKIQKEKASAARWRRVQKRSGQDTERSVSANPEMTSIGSK
jgi:hypothetical protein